MKVIVFTHTMPRYAGDAAAAFMTGLGNGMLKAGLDVVFVAPWHPQWRLARRSFSEGGRNPQQQFKIITYHYFPIHSLEVFGYSGTLYSDIKIRPLQMFLAPFVIIFGVLTVLKLVKREKIEVISAHWLVPGGLIAAIVKLFTHVSTHVSLPGSDVFLAQRNPIVRPLALWAALSADLITTNSPQLGKDLVALGVNKKIVPLIYGVEPSEFRTKKRDSNKLRWKIVLGVGRLVEKKGFKYLVEAIAKISKQFPNVKLILVGDGDERQILQNQARELGIADRVEFPGFLAPAKLKQLYPKVDIFVLPSIRDQAGNLDDQSVAAVEAMAAGLPVVVSDWPGYRLVIEQGKTGLLVKPGSVRGLEAALTKLLDNPGLGRKLGRVARKAVEEKFSTTAIGRQYRKLFEQLT